MEVEKEISGRKFVFQSIKYKELKKMKKVAGEDKDILNDLIILSSIKEPKITQNELDEMELNEIIEINTAVAELTGVDVNKIKGF